MDFISQAIFSCSYTYQSPLNELLLTCFSILFLATPGFKGRGLQSTAI